MNTTTFTLRTTLRANPSIGTLASAAATRVLATLAAWRLRAQERAQLAQYSRMSGHRLSADTGLTGCDIREDLSKPFWKA